MWHFYPREGYVLWVTGMLLVLFSNKFSTVRFAPIDMKASPSTHMDDLPYLSSSLINCPDAVQPSSVADPFPFTIKPSAEPIPTCHTANREYV